MQGYRLIRREDLGFVISKECKVGCTILTCSVWAVECLDALSSCGVSSGLTGEGSDFHGDYQQRCRPSRSFRIWYSYGKLCSPRVGTVYCLYVTTLVIGVVYFEN
jgi:hypothetical protein